MVGRTDTESEPQRWCQSATFPKKAHGGNFQIFRISHRSDRDLRPFTGLDVEALDGMMSTESKIDIGGTEMGVFLRRLFDL